MPDLRLCFFQLENQMAYGSKMPEPVNRGWQLFAVLLSSALAVASSPASAADLLRPCTSDTLHDLSAHIAVDKFGSTKIPKGLQIEPAKGRFKFLRPSGTYKWPVLDKKYSMTTIACQLSCGPAFKVACIVQSEPGIEWLAMRLRDDTFLYIPFDDAVERVK